MRFSRLFLAAALTLGAATLGSTQMPAATAFAQEVATATPAAAAVAQDSASSKVSLAPLAEVLGLVGLAVMGFVAALLNGAYARFKVWTGITVEARQSDAVLAAIRRGVFFGLDKVGDLIGGSAIDVRSTIVAEAINYTLRTVAGHVKALGLTESHIGDVAAAMFSEIQRAPAKPTVPMSVSQAGAALVATGG